VARIDEVKRSLARYRPGQPIHLRLEDGSRLTGTFRCADNRDDVVYLERPEARVEMSRIAGILVDVSTQGPE
jgi:hypothetical protein